MAVWRLAEQLTKAIKAMIGMILNAFIVLSVFVCLSICVVQSPKNIQISYQNRSFVFEFVNYSNLMT